MGMKKEDRRFLAMPSADRPYSQYISGVTSKTRPVPDLFYDVLALVLVSMTRPGGQRSRKSGIMGHTV